MDSETLANCRREKVQCIFKKLLCGGVHHGSFGSNHIQEESVVQQISNSAPLDVPILLLHHAKQKHYKQNSMSFEMNQFALP